MSDRSSRRRSALADGFAKWFAHQHPNWTDIAVAIDRPQPGLSSDTLMLEVESATASEKYVARLPPLGETVFPDYDLARQAKVQNAVAAQGIPAARVIANETDLGWIGAERPQMIAVQAAGCAPIAKAWDDARPTAEFWPNAATLAAGLRVPKAYGDYLILDILKKSGGVALTVTDDQIMDAVREWGRVEGVFAAPEGAAALAAYRKLRYESVDSADSNRTLARWCHKNKLADEARAHWLKVFEFEPEDSEARGALGLHEFEGRLQTNEQIAQAKRRYRHRENNDSHRIV